MTASSPSTPDPRLPEGLHHVLYEMRMLMDCFEYLQNKPADSDSLMHDACLESFIIHARALDDFFTTPENRKFPDDTRAWHFPNTGVTEPKKKDCSHPYIDRMHKEIAHLSYSREVSHKNRRWDIADVLKAHYQDGSSLLSKCHDFLRLTTTESLVNFGQNRAIREKLLGWYKTMSENPPLSTGELATDIQHGTPDPTVI
jgi:hypothetical protein